MKFDDKIAAILLELIADVTPEAHLKESVIFLFAQSCSVLSVCR
jgi:hypothetical protein